MNNILHITRECALDLYIKHNIGNISDQELEKVVDEMLSTYCYNTCQIGTDSVDNDILLEFLGY